MSQKYFYEKTFSNKNFTKKTLPFGEYEQCVFSNCNFSNVDLSEIKFIESEFTNCDLSNAQIHKTAFQEVHFDRCKILGLHWEDCNKFNFAVHFKNCQLNHSSFYQVKLNQSSFIKCQLIGVDFIEANLKGIQLIKSDFLNAVFENTNMESADLRQSSNYNIDPIKNKIQRARFSIPDVINLLKKYDLKIDF